MVGPPDSAPVVVTYSDGQQVETTLACVRRFVALYEEPSFRWELKP